MGIVLGSSFVFSWVIVKGFCDISIMENGVVIGYDIMDGELFGVLFIGDDGKYC